jgi:hypothetical protein
MMVMKGNLINSRSHKHTITLEVTFAFNNMFKNDSQSRPFHIIGTSFVVCVVETTSKVIVALSCKKQLIFFFVNYYKKLHHIINVIKHVMHVQKN